MPDSSMIPERVGVDILMATYNGERFLEAQLASLESQTHEQWRLIVRDDGSTDATNEILGAFAARNPARVVRIRDERGRLGAGGSFATLLGVSTAEYGCFCDQDDVWRPDKIEMLLQVALAHAGAGRPLLVHSDLEVVDKDMRTMAASFWRHQFIRPERCLWSQLLVQNVVTGCACLFNASLRRGALPVPSDAIMHDWWLALVAASSGGTICCVPDPLVRYRQHGANDTGAKKWDLAYMLRHAPEFFRRDAFRIKFRAYQRQAAVLARHPYEEIPGSVRDLLLAFSDLSRLSYADRVRFLWRHRVLKTGVLRNVALLARI